MDFFALIEPFRRKSWPGYVAALVLPALAVLLRLALGDILKGVPFLTFFPAVLITAFVGNWRSAALSVTLSGLLAKYFLIPPLHSIDLVGISDWMSVAVFFMVCATMTGLVELSVRAAQQLLDTRLALRQANEALENRVTQVEAEQKVLADVVEATDMLVLVVDLDHRLMAINKAGAEEFARIYGVRTPGVGDSMLDLLSGKPEHRGAVNAMWSRALAGEEFVAIEEFGDPQLDRRAYEIKFNVLRNSDGKQIGAFQFVFDVTERLRAQAELLQTQDALRQSQKMEALGKLTGGVAHDFNNMLQVVIGSLTLALRRIANGKNDIVGFVDNAMDGANRAAELTRRLLAFSRQQPLAPVSTDINSLIQDTAELLRRTLGETIVLECVLGGGLWRAFIDPGQLDNGLLNLAINAKDAMPTGGKLTIETFNTHLDNDYSAAHDEVAAGQYVMLAVTDTGTGMPPEVAAKAFDPFFTTKEPGKGTGLGLSQVHGFVKQSGGHVKIYSEVGRGTTIKLYLPRDPNPQQSASPQLPVWSSSGSTGELILLVEDDLRVRQTTRATLQALGYETLEADGPEAALSILQQEISIDLMLTDIVMPGMSGSALVERALALRPNLKVLYMTGYTRNAIVHNGVLDADVELIMKPFTVDQLGRRIHDLLRDNPGERR